MSLQWCEAKDVTFRRAAHFQASAGAVVEVNVNAANIRDGIMLCMIWQKEKKYSDFKMAVGRG